MCFGSGSALAVTQARSLEIDSMVQRPRATGENVPLPLFGLGEYGLPHDSREGVEEGRREGMGVQVPDPVLHHSSISQSTVTVNIPFLQDLEYSPGMW